MRVVRTLVYAVDIRRNASELWAFSSSSFKKEPTGDDPMKDNVYRCDWCGRFYSSPLPEPSACRDHIPEHNARLTENIRQFNAKLAERHPTMRQEPEDLSNLAAERRMLDARYLEESRRRFNAQTRNQQLRAVLQDASAFLEHIEWNDTTSEHDAENLRHQIDEALSTLDPTP